MRSLHSLEAQARVATTHTHALRVGCIAGLLAHSVDEIVGSSEEKMDGGGLDIAERRPVLTKGRRIHAIAGRGAQRTLHRGGRHAGSGWHLSPYAQARRDVLVAWKPSVGGEECRACARPGGSAVACAAY